MILSSSMDDNDNSIINSLLNVSDIFSNREDLIRFLWNYKITLWQLSDFMMGMCIFYGVLFCFGILGNLWVICIIGYIMKVLRGVVQNPNVFLYIFCLSIVDALVLLNLPLLITNMYLYQWIFGPYLCKIYWIVESTNKTLSTFILAALSFDRYVAVCRPSLKYSMRRAKGTMAIMVSLFLTVVILLTPVYWYANEYASTETFMINNITLEIHVPACNLVMNHDLVVTFTVYLFLVGFCSPSVLIIFFYSRILYTLYKRSKSIHVSQIPVRRVTCTILMLIIFYFVCWTPYWVITLHSVLGHGDIVGVDGFELAHILHSLVYINSAFNWILYAVLNKNLRDCKNVAFKKRSRQITSTQLQLDIVDNFKRKTASISKPKTSPTSGGLWV